MTWVSLLIAAAVTIGGCGFNERSGAYACPNGNECVDGRFCSEGWCVVPAPIDAAPDANLFVCPDECDRCEGRVCVFDCSALGSCLAKVVCPAVDCRVDCKGVGTCGGGVDCSQASACEVECTGLNSCGAQIVCGSGACALECGAGACSGGLECSNSCSCDMSCAGVCGTANCPGPNACFKDGVCTSEPGSCQNC